jgi:hypothetical protein
MEAMKDEEPGGVYKNYNVECRKMADGDAASAQSRRRSADGTGAGRGPPMEPPEIITNVLNQKL